MLFKGTEKRSALQIVQEVEQVGGEFNAFTTQEYTCFHVTLLADDLKLGVEILEDVMLNSQFDPEELERERKVILQEIAMIEESPEELAHDLFLELSYGRHGLGRNILGSSASIRRMRRADLLRFFRKHYRPDQLVIAVAGDVSHAEVLKLVSHLRRHDWPGRTREKASRREMGIEVAPPPKKDTWWVIRQTEQVHLLWGWEAPKYSSRDRMAASLLNLYLGGGMSSRLFQEVREKSALAYTVYSSLSTFIDTGILNIYLATNPSQVPQAAKIIEETLEQICSSGIKGEELASVKSNIKGMLLLGADDIESRMINLARNENFLGEWSSVEEFCEEIDQITSAEIRRVARRIFRHQKPALIALGPRPSPTVRRKMKPKILNR